MIAFIFLFDILLLLSPGIQITDGTCPLLKLATAGLITILFGFKDFHSSVHLFKSARNMASDIFLLLIISLTPDQSHRNVMSLD